MTCRTCGAEFEPKAKGRAHAAYCSPQCRKRAWQERTRTHTGTTDEPAATSDPWAALPSILAGDPASAEDGLP